MIKQIIFALTLIVTLLVFSYTFYQLFRVFQLTKSTFAIGRIGERLLMTLKVAIGQTKILRKPVIGVMHAIVFWGFCVILFGSVEMVIDGVSGSERILSFLGPVYDLFMASGDIFAFLILIFIIAFLIRRVFMNIRRFSGAEMSHLSHVDANFSLTLILLLMVSLLGMNVFYLLHADASGHQVAGLYPVSEIFASWLSSVANPFLFHEVSWWVHILLIFFFANYLPYSKHFHVFMSVPNVFLSRLEPLGKLDNMDQVMDEVKIMLNPAAGVNVESAADVVERFGVLDAEDVSWKNYLDSLACTQCGRCTEVCPANLTGKLLSPRKLMMDLRFRMKEKSSGLLREGKDFSDSKNLINDYFTREEIWACTTCNACAQECPININHPSLIIDLRRFIVMEEAGAPAELNMIFSNIENNGAPWQFSPEDRMNWDEKKEARLYADLQAAGKSPEYLVWIGSAGAFDDRYKKVSRAFIRVLNHVGVDYGVLGTEESSSGDVARRAGNEMLFQMQALMNIEIFTGYGVKKIITCDPHAYNTFKNEYPDLGGHFEVIHHSAFLLKLLSDPGRSELLSRMKGVATFHDPCYLGRANSEYDAPRDVIRACGLQLNEMKRNKSFALCCGAGGGQMFKEAEKGNKEIYMARTEDVVQTGADVLVTACPYCMVMLTDGLKYTNKSEQIKNYDLAELAAEVLGV